MPTPACRRHGGDRRGGQAEPSRCRINPCRTPTCLDTNSATPGNPSRGARLGGGGVVAVASLASLAAVIGGLYLTFSASRARTMEDERWTNPPPDARGGQEGLAERVLVAAGPAPTPPAAPSPHSPPASPDTQSVGPWVAPSPDPSVSVPVPVSTSPPKSHAGIQANGGTPMFGEGAGANTRDPKAQVLTDGNGQPSVAVYYTAINHTGPNGDKATGADYVRTTTDLTHWSGKTTVASGGTNSSWSMSGPWSSECPHVISHSNGWYYLFRTQHYGGSTSLAQSSVFASHDWTDFGVGNTSADAHLVTRLPVAAPELVFYQGDWYIAALKTGIDGIRLSRIDFV
eukprot:gene9453-1699_t